MKFLYVFLIGATLTGCAENFTWEDPATWRFKMTKEEKIRHIYERACVDGLNENDRRLLMMNGISGAALQTECIPYTQRPLTPQRFEGR